MANNQQLKNHSTVEQPITVAPTTMHFPIWPVYWITAALGIGLSWAALSGDEAGRINLLYLMTIYVFLPIASLLLSIASMLFSKGLHLSRWLLKLPFWHSTDRAKLNQLRRQGMDKIWLFHHTQIAALLFVLASLIVLFILLLTTDMNFIWRSTLLDATDLLPMLNLIALQRH